MAYPNDSGDVSWAVASVGVELAPPLVTSGLSCNEFCLSEGRCFVQHVRNNRMCWQHWSPGHRAWWVKRSAGPPRQLRSKQLLWGVPGLRGVAAADVDFENVQVRAALNALKWALSSQLVCVVVMPSSSMFWLLPEVIKFLRGSTAFKSEFRFEGNLEGLTSVTLLHNCAKLDNVVGSRGVGVPLSPLAFLRFYAHLVRGAADAWVRAFPPAETFSCTSWCLRALTGATRGLACPLRARALAVDLADMLGCMRLGTEAQHLQSLLRFVDLRGADVHLVSQTLLGELRQVLPYPAFCWDWKEFQTYKWRQTAHINVLELTAVLNYLGAAAKDCHFHDRRHFHVLDSQVCCAVLAKGRSSSIALLRILRRIIALTLTCNLYLYPAWTLSGWNFGDGASRQFEHNDDG